MMKIFQSSILLTLPVLPASIFAADELTANPSRPTVSNAAETTPAGNLEVEYGLAANTPGSPNLAEAFSSLVRLCVRDALELRWGFDN
jgi:hypothetical protein